MSNPQANRFQTTRWSLILRARDSDPAGRRALEELCGVYWSPVYGFFRRGGMEREAARDLTQGLFADLLERGNLAGGDPQQGRFRSYLLACAKHYRSNDADRQRAQKRGGGRALLPLSFADDDERSSGVFVEREPRDDEDPERAFFRSWALVVLRRVLQILQNDEEKKGRGDVFAVLRIYLEGDETGPGYARVGQRLGCSEGAVKVAVHRLRRRFRDLLLREVGDTVSDAEAAMDEVRALLAALSRDSGRC